MRFRSNWILEVLVFEERGKRENRRETSRNKERTNNKLNQHMASTPGFDPGPNWREANAPTTAKPLLPKLFREPFLSYHRREEWWEKGKGETNAFYLFPPFPASCCFNHYCYCFIFGKPVGDCGGKITQIWAKITPYEIPIVVLSSWTLPLYRQTPFSIASHADITRDEPLRTSAWEATFQ